MSAEIAFGNAFVSWYFQAFNEGKENLAGVYADNTLITFQDQQITGTNPRTGQLNIIERLTSLGLVGMTKRPIVIQAQPSIGGTVLICVQGNCRMSPDEAEELGFFEIFLVARTEEGSFQIVNQVFSTSSV